MNEFATYLKSVKDRMGFKSDRQMARALGVSQPHISDIIRGYRFPSEDFAVRVANMVGDDPGKAILLLHRAKASKETRRYWDKIMKAVISAGLVLVLAAAPALSTAAPHKIYYVNFIVLLCIWILVKNRSLIAKT